MKRFLWPILSFGTLGACILLLLPGGLLLGAFQLSFRPWVNFFLLALGLLAAVSGLLSCGWFLMTRGFLPRRRTLRLEIPVKIGSVLGTLAALALCGCLVFLGFWVLLFSPQEHLVWQDDRHYIACVSQDLLHTSVTLHPMYGAFLMGADGEVIYTIDASIDPFTSDAETDRCLPYYYSRRAHCWIPYGTAEPCFSFRVFPPWRGLLSWLSTAISPPCFAS